MAVYFTLAGRMNDVNAPTRLTLLDAENRSNEVVQVAQIIDPRIESLTVGSSTANTPFIAVKVSNLRTKVPLSYLGTGVTIVVTIALAILASKDGVVFIDELEIGIHHSSLEEVVKALSSLAFKQNCQIIATSHSYECINAAFNVFKDQEDRRFTYLRLERNKNNKIISKVYPKDTLSYALDSEWEIR